MTPKHHEKKIEVPTSTQSLKGVAAPAGRVASWAERNKTQFLTGLGAVVPVALVFFVGKWMWGKGLELYDLFFGAIVPAEFDGLLQFLMYIKPVLTFGAIAAVIWFLGWMVQRQLFMPIQRMFEGLISRLPVLGSLYSIGKQVSEALFPKANGDAVVSFTGVAMVPFPVSTSRVPGLITKRLNEWVAVFIPTSPTPWSGFTVWYHQDDVHEVEDLGIDDSLKFVTSCGLISDPEMEEWLETHKTIPTGSNAE